MRISRIQHQARRGRRRLTQAVTTTGLTALLALGQVPLLAHPASAASAADAGGFDANAAELVRQEQCLLSGVMRIGGPAMKQAAGPALDGTVDQTAAVADPSGAHFAGNWNGMPMSGPLSTAYKADYTARMSALDALNARPTAWGVPLRGLPEPAGYTSLSDFEDPPSSGSGGNYFDTVGLTPWLGQWFVKAENDYYPDPTPTADAAGTAAALALGDANFKQPTNGNDPNFQQELAESSAWTKLAWNRPRLNADDTRLLLESGGFARTAPAPGTVEYRIAVEDLKSRFASCEWRNPLDPNQVLGPEVQSAATEWQAEVDAQATQRAAVFAANARATTALQTGAQALGEALGQAWLADHLTHWEAFWQPGGPGAADGQNPITFHLNAATTRCVDDQGGKSANGSPLQSYACNTAYTQHWYPMSLGPDVNGDGRRGALDGALAMFASNTALAPTKCLDVDGTHGAPHAGTKVQLWDCNKSANQHWQYTTTQGKTRLYNVGTKLCLDFGTGASGVLGTVNPCNGSAGQQFTANQTVPTAGSSSSYHNAYPKAAEFAAAAKALAATQAAAKAQLAIAQQQAQTAQTAASDSDTAVQQAYAVADAAGMPRGRGLLAGGQEAQVTKASAAALQAVAKAAQTAYQATTASVADSTTLQQLAQTQTAASTAAFRLAAAAEAAAQAKAAQQGAALQAANAAKAATDAQTQLAIAQQAVQTAKAAAATAHAKRLAAESEQATAAAAKNQAAADRAQAAADQQTADSDASAAANALAAAQAAQATAAQKSGAAHQADQAATTARTAAWDAEQRKNALQAKARAADAYADAESANSDATDARNAADQADQDAANATTDADHASAAATAATQAAADADAAAQQAAAAASRAQADANDAAAAKAIADAAVKTDEAAAAKAIGDAQQASQDAAGAQQEAATAEAQAKAAQADAIASGAAAQQAQSNAATTAGFAYTTAQAATAAAGAAGQVVQPANDAIQLGAPYVDSDSAAGLAVLTAQASKTVAEQQQAAAQAKADQAAQAATSAQALADAASGDAKDAQVQAANAAASAAAAQVSVQQALASAALAQKYAAQTQATVAQAIQYDQQAAADSAAAQSAAQAAAGDAADAKASATAAEADASAAQAAAAQAQASAATAREVAKQADSDAAAAEAAAKDASAQAASAQQAATLAEQQQDQKNLDSGGPTGTPHVYTTETVNPTKDPEPQNTCVLGLGNSGCDVTFLLTFDLTIDFYYCDNPAAPTDVTAAGCPPENAVFLGSQVEPGLTQTVVHHFSNWDITKTIDEAVLKGLWESLKSDFLDCSNGSVRGCVMAATWFTPPNKIIEALRIANAVRDAIKASTGLDEALTAVRAALNAKTIDRVTAAGLNADLATRAAELARFLRDVDPKLVAKLQAMGVDFSRKDVLWITTMPGGKIAFLETGRGSAGLIHVIAEHGAEFVENGIALKDVPDLIRQALTVGKVIGYQGADKGRPIYELVYNGVLRHVAITVGDNGFVVGANLA